MKYLLRIWIVVKGDKAAVELSGVSWGDWLMGINILGWLCLISTFFFLNTGLSPPFTFFVQCFDPCWDWSGVLLFDFLLFYLVCWEWLDLFCWSFSYVVQSFYVCFVLVEFCLSKFAVFFAITLFPLFKLLFHWTFYTSYVLGMMEWGCGCITKLICLIIAFLLT